jgi:DNA-binding transcriptional regulator YhcF (GntR family)
VERLDASEWQPGDAIPSEIELAARFNVSQGTVRKAIDVLAADNLLVRRQGKGTYVATHTEEKHSMFRFLRIRRNDGLDEYPVSRLIDVRRARASSEAARALALKAGAPVIVLRRVLEYGGEPAVLDEIVVSAALFKGLTRPGRRLPRVDVQPVRNPVRRSHRQGAGETARGRCGRAVRRAAPRRARATPARRRARDLYLCRPGRRVAPRTVHDAPAPLSERPGLTRRRQGLSTGRTATKPGAVATAPLPV